MYPTANGMYGLVRVPRRKKIPRLSLSNAFNRRSVEALVTQAYFQLIRVAWSDLGSRSVALAKYGCCEVRLVERKPTDDADAPHMSVELHAKDVQTPIEVIGCDDLEAAAIAAEQIMAKAERMQSELLSNLGRSEPRRTDSGN